MIVGGGVAFVVVVGGMVVVVVEVVVVVGAAANPFLLRWGKEPWRVAVEPDANWIGLDGVEVVVITANILMDRTVNTNVAVSRAYRIFGLLKSSGKTPWGLGGSTMQVAVRCPAGDEDERSPTGFRIGKPPGQTRIG